MAYSNRGQLLFDLGNPFKRKLQAQWTAQAAIAYRQPSFWGSSDRRTVTANRANAFSDRGNYAALLQHCTFVPPVLLASAVVVENRG